MISEVRRWIIIVAAAALVGLAAAGLVMVASRPAPDRNSFTQEIPGVPGLPSIDDPRHYSDNGNAVVRIDTPGARPGSTGR